jgi:hypothetical protein
MSVRRVSICGAPLSLGVLLLACVADRGAPAAGGPGAAGHGGDGASGSGGALGADPGMARAPGSPGAVHDNGGSSDAGASTVDASGEPVAGEGDAAPEHPLPLPIDLSIWQLQLPIGSGTTPTTISAVELVTGFSDAYFYRSLDGGQVFMDPATGITTSGSQHCRTELREMTPDGRAAAWPSTGTNTLNVAGRILQVGGGASGHVTVGQVFNGTDSIPLAELEYSTKAGGFQLLYEEQKGGGTTTDLKAPVALGAPYSFTLELSRGVLTVGIGGKALYTKTPSAAVAAKTFYFKTGNYDQTATAGPISSTPYTIVEVVALDVTHR